MLNLEHSPHIALCAKLLIKMFNIYKKAEK